MSITWDCSECAAHHTAKEAAMSSGEFNKHNEVWSDYCDLREALIWALIAVRFPDKSSWQITEKNWEEVYKRLYILERTDHAYRSYFVGEGEPNNEVYFSPEEIHSMIGMKVNAGNLSTAKFKTFIFKRLMEKAQLRLDKFKEEK